MMIRKSKTRITLSCIFFILLMILISKIYDNLHNKSMQASKSSGKILSSSEKNNSIDFKEDIYFNTYEIKGVTAFDQLKVEESSYMMKILLPDGSLSDLKGFKDISFKKEEGGISIYVSKLFQNDNKAFIDKDDKSKIIIMTSKSDKPYKYKIVVDPGHGGADSGANYGSVFEKDIAFKISKFLEQELERRQCRVVLTRDSDKLLGLREISDISNKAEPDVFVSIHINSNDDSKYSGMSTYYQASKYMKSDEGKALAKIIQAEIVKSDSWSSMGIKGDNLSVLRNTKAPSALVECGFISNEEDRRKLQNDEVLKNIASNIAEGLIKYLDGKAGL